MNGSTTNPPGGEQSWITQDRNLHAFTVGCRIPSFTNVAGFSVDHGYSSPNQCDGNLRFHSCTGLIPGFGTVPALLFLNNSVS